MHSSDPLEASPAPRRRRYDPQFKAELVAYCQQRGISVASVARDHGINANLVRRWIQEQERYGDLDVSTTPSPIQRDVAAQFIAVPTSVSNPIEASSAAPSPHIQIKLERGDSIVSIQWPLSHAQQCAAWLNEVIR